MASGKLLYSTGNSVLCDDLEGQDGGMGGREVQEAGDICIHTAGSLLGTAEN